MAVTPFHRGGSGEPLVLLHGFTNTWRAWTPILPGLEERFAVFAPTLPGHLGAETAAAELEPLSMASMTDALERQLDAQGIEQAHFVGNSLGGWLSLELALRGRARSVVGLCPAGGWETGSREEQATYRFFWRNSHVALPLSRPFFSQLARRPKLRKLAFRDVVTDPLKLDAGLALATLEAAAGCEVTRGLLAASKKGELFDELGEIACPVTIATAAGDHVFPSASYFTKFRQVIPAAEWVALGNLGHLPMSDDPDRVTEVILSGTRAASSA
jgi:pimeloyl-ACP methyl ester carboxylesterase